MSNVKIKLRIRTGYVGCNHEDFEYVDRAIWEAMSEDEQILLLDDLAIVLLERCIEYSAYVVED